MPEAFCRAAWGAWAPGLDPLERYARLREVRSLAWLLIGRESDLVALLARAELSPTAAGEAAEVIARLPPRTICALFGAHVCLLRTRAALLRERAR